MRRSTRSLRQVRILWGSDPRFADHDAGPGHPERPARLVAVDKGVELAGLGDALVRFTPEPATRDAIAAVHPGDYLQRIEDLTAAGGGHIDADTAVSAGSWDALLLAAGAGLGAVDRLDAGAADVAFVAVRPPGHHATPTRPMGFCLVNNVAVTAASLAARGARVAVVDVDAHHGNGTQSLFYDRADVLYASVHVDPGAGWFPHYLGFADETGRDAGVGANLNVPLAPGSGDEVWWAGLRRCCDAVTDHGATALVVSLGVDAAADDPESPLQVTADGYRGTGELLGSLALPTVAVQEGGYHLDTIGALVAATLDGLAAGQP